MQIDHKETFKDFGDQFLTDKDIGGYWGSIELLKEIVFPFDLNSIKNKKIIDVGIGSGRISNNLLKYDPSKLVAVEPSDAINIAKENIKSDKVEYLNIKGQDMNFQNDFDYAFALCVIHHIPEYKEVLKKIEKSLKPNGKFVAWVYSKEGMELYIFMLKNLRRITSIMPDFILRIFSQFLAILTYPYGFLCRFLPLPLKKYFVTMFNKFSFKHKSYVIFDQFNPSFYKYFSKKELTEVLEETGFKVEILVNTVGHQYTVVCSKKL
jgi:ubiquinone/menaquinone biosynthesis C-methylase UbiE